MPSQTQASSSEPQAGSSSLCLSPALSPLLFLFFLVSSPRAACGNNRNKGTMWWERQGDPGHGPLASLPAPHSVCDLRQVTASPQCWGDRPVPPHLVCSRAGNRTQGFMLARHTLCQRNHLLSQASLFFLPHNVGVRFAASHGCKHSNERTDPSQTPHRNNC